MSQVEREQRREERRVTLNLLRNLTKREISAQYKRTALGRIWSLINPLAQIAVYSIVFGLLIQIPVAAGTNSGLTFFPIWIGVGVIAWGAISNSITAGMGSMLGNAGLLTMAFVLGIAMLLSVASIYFRDIVHLWSIVSQVWMYASGVMFSVQLVRDAQQRIAEDYGLELPLVTLFQLNPAERFLTAYRNILYDFAVPSWDVWVALVLWSVGSLVVGKLVFDRLARNIVEEI